MPCPKQRSENQTIKSRIRASAKVAGRSKIRPAPPTPGERMREWAMERRRKQAQEHGEVPDSPEYGEPSPVSHYGKSPVTPGISTTPKTAPSLENQSIYPSIKHTHQIKTLYPATGKACGNPKGQWQGQAVGHPDYHGQIDTAMRPPGDGANL